MSDWCGKVAQTLLLVTMLAGCGRMLGLRDDLAEINANFAMISGTVESEVCQRCDIVLAGMSGDQPARVVSYRILGQTGNLEFAVPAEVGSLFAFHDSNSDFTFQPGEPYATFSLPDGLKPDGAPRQFSLRLRKSAAPPAPGVAPIGNLFGSAGVVAEDIALQFGTIATLDEPRFALDVAKEAMWQPLKFLKAGHAGIYFLQPYDPKKVPVLFIHGISGSPKEFSALVAALDRSRFQPWLAYFPSGLEVPSVSFRLQGQIDKLHHRYHFKTMHIVAHSMGGLVARSLLNDCRQIGNCTYLRTFVSLNSPFGGDWAAQGGVDHSPVVMPVWHSMSQQGEFLRTLFAQPLPPSVRHHLVFGYRNEGLFTSKSGDGTIPHDSQLRSEAQQQASSVRGFNATHGGILVDADAVAYVNQLLVQSAAR